tara:strand:+ start:5149 stop:6402 length:1254 start_codon:yes stop_codon:yes gene_type:complete
VNNYFIIGKVNEGKSFLFNLFSKTHKTISNRKANTTIDIIRKNIFSENFEYKLYDTPGFYKLNDFNNLFDKIMELNLENVSFIYITSSFTNEDLKICKQLFNKKFNLLLFSFKNINEKDYIPNLFNKIFTNYADNLTVLKKYLSNENKKQLIKSDTFNKKIVAIFGKENTGKSTLFNKIMNISLSKTSPNLHTTRDSVNWDIKFKNQTIEFIDTAGFIRSRSNRKNLDFEKQSIEQSEYFIKNASLIILLLDASSESRLDLSLIGSLSKRNKPFLVLVNKIDLVDNKFLYQQNFIKYLSSNHNYYSSLNIYFISALHSSKSKILQIVSDQLNNNFFFKTSYLNKIIKSVNGELGKIQKNSKEFKIYFVTAFTVNKKNYFKISCNFSKKNIKPHIKTYVSKILIRELNLKGISFNLIF